MKHLWRISAALLLGAILTLPLGCGGSTSGTQLTPHDSPQLPLPSLSTSPFAAAPDDFDVNDPGKVASASFVKFYLDTVNQYSGGRWTVANTSGMKAFTLKSNTYA